MLDALFREDGQTLSALQSRFDVTRFAVMKHLKQLEEAGLVVTRRGASWARFIGACVTRGRAPYPATEIERCRATAELTGPDAV